MMIMFCHFGVLQRECSRESVILQYNYTTKLKEIITTVILSLSCSSSQYTVYLLCSKHYPRIPSLPTSRENSSFSLSFYCCVFISLSFSTLALRAVSCMSRAAWNRITTQQTGCHQNQYGYPHMLFEKNVKVEGDWGNIRQNCISREISPLSCTAPQS